MASLMFGDISEFFGSYLKDYDLKDFVILITGRDIITGIKERVGTQQSYTSRYKNVMFAPKLAPTATVEEFFWGGTRDKTEFVTAYKNQLLTKENLTDVCALVDLVVNKNKNVVLLCSKRENIMEYYEYLREFLDEYFKLYMVSIKEAMVDNELLYKYGDDDEIRTMLMFQIKANNITDQTFGEFINKFVDDEAKKYKEVLMSKSIDELVAIGTKYSVHVNKYKQKEFIVEHILKKIMQK
jgi:uncharacterized protein YeaO (DUF488 family)